MPASRARSRFRALGWDFRGGYEEAPPGSKFSRSFAEFVGVKASARTVPLNPFGDARNTRNQSLATHEGRAKNGKSS